MSTTQNLLTFSQSLSNWTTLVSNKGTYTDNIVDILAPDGTQTVTKFAATAGGSSVYGKYLTVTYLSQIYTLSVYAKAGTYGALVVDLMNTGSSGVLFNLNNGTIVAYGNPAYSATITAVGDGWYRCSVTSSLSSGVLTGTGFPEFYLSGNTSSIVRTWSPVGTETVYLWGAQLVQSNWPGSYISTLTKPADNGIIRSIIGNTQNLMLNNEAIPTLGGNVASNGAVSDPYGGTGAWQLSYNGAGVSGDIRSYGPSAALWTGQTYKYFTWSVWLRVTSGTRNMRLRVLGAVATSAFVSIGPVTTVWQRFSITFQLLGDVSPNACTFYVYDGAGNNTAFVYEQFGSQLVVGTSIGPYNKTGATANFGTYGNLRSLA